MVYKIGNSISTLESQESEAWIGVLNPVKKRGPVTDDLGFGGQVYSNRLHQLTPQDIP